jgi:hypothetical protein
MPLPLLPPAVPQSRVLRALLAQDFGHVVDMNTFRAEEAFFLAAVAMVPAVTSVKLLANKEQYITLWYNADDNMTSGGRAVEAGSGPNYYTTIGDCRVAIKRALWQLRHPEKSEYDTPENGESDVEEDKSQQ